MNETIVMPDGNEIYVSREIKVIYCLSGEKHNQLIVFRDPKKNVEEQIVKNAYSVQGWFVQ